MTRIGMQGLIAGIAVCVSPALFAQMEQNPNPNATQQVQQGQSGNATRSPVDEGRETAAAPGATGQEMRDKIFLREAVQGGIGEVKMSQLASQKATSTDVKAFSTKMVTDHTAMGEELKNLADTMGIRVPKDLSKEDKAEYEKLSSLAGDDFEKEYITFMIKDHYKDVRAFRREVAATNDGTLRVQVDKDENVIRDHAHAITKIGRDRGINLLPPGHTPATPPSPPPAQ